MFHSDKMANGVRPIRFKPMNEDDSDRSQVSRLRHDENNELNMTNVAAARRRSPPLEPNLALDLHCQAVTLEDVCFSVDKSQQQSNFLNECLFRLNRCLNPSCGGGQQTGADSSKVQILKSVNLSVPLGTIFGLLGPSSCGKTTLLRCLVGLLKPDSGSIRLFGASSFNKPAGDSVEGGLCSRGASSDCKAPGANVGYMPQDLGLYEDFTINQLLTMFGNYMRMDADLIEARIKFMANFLELPHIDREIQTLSGGQKRRVSFAIACLHMPPLIILDEPTVGVDPLLRRSIWKYLRRLASEENKTIIITTHYIEEAARADQVALMRAGRILVQDSPGRIIKSNNARTLEEAFLKICNDVQRESDGPAERGVEAGHKSVCAQPQFQWPAALDEAPGESSPPARGLEEGARAADGEVGARESVIRELKLRAQEKLAIYDELNCNRLLQQNQVAAGAEQPTARRHQSGARLSDNLCMTPDAEKAGASFQAKTKRQLSDDTSFSDEDFRLASGAKKRNRLFRGEKFVLNEGLRARNDHHKARGSAGDCSQTSPVQRSLRLPPAPAGDGLRRRISKGVTLFWALLYKNYRRNVNSIPLLAFQFMLPMIQMISFSLCVGGRPTSVGLGVVNQDSPISFLPSASFDLGFNETANANHYDESLSSDQNDSLSLSYLSYIDKSMINVKLYDDLSEALDEVRQAKLWAVLVIGPNFTSSIRKRFDLENFYQLDLTTINQSVIRLYPDRSNKILDMICHRSLVDSYRKFLAEEFEHFKRMPVEIAKPIFDIKPNVISNSIDGYTESIAPGLLASLTYIMAAGLTTFIMVVERSAGILERTYTSGISPVSYLLAHAIFRSFVMMIQIAFVLILTFYVLQQPLVGSIWLAYSMLMILNMTGISYGLLISSIVTDQNGAALTIVSSLVVKITLSGILWPFEAIPHWLRAICYIQPLTMPVQALKAITLKGATVGDRAVNLGFLVSISWLIVFLTISTKRFKFYQH